MFIGFGLTTNVNGDFLSLQIMGNFFTLQMGNINVPCTLQTAPYLQTAGMSIADCRMLRLASKPVYVITRV